MKALLSTTIVGALIAVSSLAYAGGMTPNRTFDLRFVGFCDGMRLTINYSTGDVTGIRTGCSHGPVRGWVGAVSGGNYDGQAVVVGIDSGTGFIYVIGDHPQNFQNKNLASGSVVNSGSWAVGAAALDLEGQASDE